MGKVESNIFTWPEVLKTQKSCTSWTKIWKLTLGTFLHFFAKRWCKCFKTVQISIKGLTYVYNFFYAGDTQDLPSTILSLLSPAPKLYHPVIFIHCFQTDLEQCAVWMLDERAGLPCLCNSCWSPSQMWLISAIVDREPLASPLKLYKCFMVNQGLPATADWYLCDIICRKMHGRGWLGADKFHINLVT